MKCDRAHVVAGMAVLAAAAGLVSLAGCSWPFGEKLTATQRLQRNLLEIGRSDKFVYAWSTAGGDWAGTRFDRFHEKTGKHPLMYFAEFRDIGGTWYSPERYAQHRADFAAVVKREYAAHHAIPLVTWHIQNPYIPPKWEGGNQGMRYRYSSKGYPQEHRYVLREIVEGTGTLCGTGRIDGVNAKAFPNPRAWFEWCLRDVAAYCRTLVDEAGERIPIVFRLFHECDGDWFWWGPGSATPEDIIAAHRLAVDILREELGRENVLFCYGPDRTWTDAGEVGKSGFLCRYPGDAWMDMLGYDDYSLGKKDVEKTTAEAIRKMRIISEEGERRGKICGIFECGAKDSCDSFYTVLHQAMTAPGVHFAILTTYDGPWTFPATEAGLADMKRVLSLPDVYTGENNPDLVK